METKSTKSVSEIEVLSNRISQLEIVAGWVVEQTNLYRIFVATVSSILERIPFVNQLFKAQMINRARALNEKTNN